MLKREKIALGLFIFGVIWYFAENMYFGWHTKPVNALEGVADFMIWVFWGLAFFIRPTRVENKSTIYEVKNGKFEMIKSEIKFNNKEEMKS